MFNLFIRLTAPFAAFLILGLPLNAQQIVTDQICSGNKDGIPIEQKPGVIECAEPVQREFQLFEPRYRVEGQTGHVEFKSSGAWDTRLRIFFNNGKTSDWIRLKRTAGADYNLFRPHPGQYLSPGVQIQLDRTGFTYRNTSGQTYRYVPY